MGKSNKILCGWYHYHRIFGCIGMVKSKTRSCRIYFGTTHAKCDMHGDDVSDGILKQVQDDGF